MIQNRNRKTNAAILILSLMTLPPGLAFGKDSTKAADTRSSAAPAPTSSGKDSSKDSSKDTSSTKDSGKNAAPADAEKTSDAASGAEKVNVDSIKEKYWARGDESEMGVVQNRLYSKAGKFEVGLFGGFLTSDPFLSTQAFGGSVGYHFSEYAAVHLVGWKTLWGPSSALQTFQDKVGATTNFNAPLGFLGAEGSASLIYGKLSLVGKSILYYDMHVLGGMGATSTESGTYFTPYVGVGQQVFLSKNMSLRLDYRIMEYTELLLEKVVPGKIGQPVQGNPYRANWTHAIVIGVDFLFGIGGKQQ